MVKATTKANQATMEEITSQEDFKQFIAMMEVTGQIESWDALDSDSQRDVVNKFYLWKEKGSPKAEMPQLKDDKEYEILSLYRTKYRGEQFIWYVTRDSKTVGKEWVHEYAQEADLDENRNPTGTFHDDTRTITKRTPKYLTPYTKELGEQLLNLAFKYNDQPICVFELGSRRVGVVDPLDMFNCDGKQMSMEVQRVLQSRRRG